jgi:hypothetical protein
MRTIILLAVVALSAGSGCHAGMKAGTMERGATLAPDAPPAPRDPYFVDKPGEVWVHGRWAWLDHQWVWQPGHHEKAREGQELVCGRWERRKNAYEWIESAWVPKRPGFAFAPGHWDWRSTQFVWILDSWEPEKTGMVWVPGRWIEGSDGKLFIDGHWAEPPPPSRHARQGGGARVTKR